MSQKKYLITGGGGKLGSYILSIFLDKSLEYAAPKKEEMNILNINQINDFVKSREFDAILHLAAISDRMFAEREKYLSYQVNVLGTRNMADIARKYNLKIYYISTDYVFPGTEGNYQETDNPAPANWYGFTKYAGELEIQNATQNYCIIRTSFRPIIWQFPTAYTNVYTSADYIDIIAREIFLCINYELNGIFHIGTPTKSLYELAKIRNPNIIPEECKDESIGKRRDLNIYKWLSKKNLREKGESKP